MAGGVYWVGADGNVWTKSAGAGVVNQGKYVSGSGDRYTAKGAEGLNTYGIGMKRINDPNPPKKTPTTNNTTPTSNSNGGGGYVASAPAEPKIDPKILAQYDQSIDNTNSALGRLAAQRKSATTAITSSRDNALNKLLLNKNRGNQTYTQNKLNTGREYVTAKNTIGSNAGVTLRGLQRLLGSRGAGGGSAFNINAPGAVVQDATRQWTGAGSVFGENNQELDTNWNNFLTDYNNERSGAITQSKNQLKELSRTIGSNKAKLLQTIAGLKAKKAEYAGGNGVDASNPYYNKANNVLKNLATYKVAPINYQTGAYEVPDIASYVTNENARPVFDGQPAQNDYTSPYLAALTGKKQKSLVGA